MVVNLVGPQRAKYSFIPKLQMRLKIQSPKCWPTERNGERNQIVKVRHKLDGPTDNLVYFPTLLQVKYLSLKCEDGPLSRLKRRIGQSNLRRHRVMRKI